MQIYRQRGKFLVLETMLCGGCGLCVERCPAGILSLNKRGKVTVQRRDVEKRCTFCSLCEQVCDRAAIWIIQPPK